MNNIIEIKHLCEQELQYLHDYCNFCNEHSSLFNVQQNKYTDFINNFCQQEKNIDALIQSKQQLLDEINDYIYDQCDHEWIDDHIDIDIEKSQQICYCCKCELNKKELNFTV